ncbi:MAG: tail fiber domain-containing protein [Fibrobacter sp.]|nr:tail fiber domain-containing protein [Fibrobacter sp.]MBQ6770477.1 tail fiber domain-containing protein [Bacteroidales bacterium]
MNIVLTNAGLQKIINAEQTGTAPVVISQIAFGSGQYVANASQIALQNEIKRLPVISGGTDDDHSIHVAAQDVSSDSYSVYEFGLFFEDGTLFAVYSQTETPILQKTISSVAQFECGIALQGVNIESISFGDVAFSYPYATETNPGIAEIATEAEAQAGIDNTRIITPANLQQVTATTDRKGVIKIATNAEAQAGTDNSLAITPENLQAVTATESRKGVIEIATNAEAQAGTDNTRALTPANLQQVTATESRKGVIEIATNAEAQAGTDNTRALTPANLQQVTATESRKGVIEIATQAETDGGTDDAKAVTPLKLKTMLPNYTGYISKAAVKATGGNSSRRLQDRFGDVLNMLDFGAKGDGTTNDTAAFTSLENAFTGRDVNLYGKTYVVTARPTGNNYYNGFFKVGNVTVKPVYDFFKFGGTAKDFLNIRRDFSEFSRGGGALLAADVVRKGENPGNVVQGAVVDSVNRYLYTLHLTTNGQAVINRFPFTKLGGAMKIDSTGYSAKSNYVGNQGLGIEYRSGGSVKLWGSVAYNNVGTASITSRGTKAVRFNPPTGNGTNVDSGIEVFNLFPEVANSSQATTVCVSYSGKYLVAKYNLSGYQFKVRIFKISDFTSAGDYSNKFIHEFTAEFTHDTGSGVERALQGIACDDRFIYFLAGGIGVNVGHTIYVYDMYGNEVDEYRDVSVGKEIGEDVGTTYYEPESLFFTEINGCPRLCLQIATGDTVEQRLCHVIALNLRQSYYFPVGVNTGSYHGVAIDEQGRMINAEGAENISFYPSGLSAEFTARTGAAQKTIARFSNDNAGAVFNLFKSRGAKVGTSRSILPGDMVAQVNFMADNGKIDYAGETIGDSVGYLQCSVLSSSSASDAGNTNLGIKGVVRVYACEDGSSNAGKGIEVMADQIRPSNDNALSNGSSSRRWSTVYAATGTIQTSDENLKEEIGEIPEAVFKAWENVKFVQYKFKDAVKEKGAKARYHIGLIAQRIVAAFEAEGLDAFEYGLVCRDALEDGGEILSLRYDECLSLECAYERNRFDQILIKLKGGDN